METVKAVICVNRYRRKKEEDEVEEQNQESSAVDPAVQEQNQEGSAVENEAEGQNQEVCEEEAQDEALPVKGEACEEADREAEKEGGDREGEGEEEEGEEVDEEVVPDVEMAAEVVDEPTEQSEVVAAEEGVEAPEDEGGGEGGGAVAECLEAEGEEEEECASDAVAMEVPDDVEEDVVQAIPVAEGVADSNPPAGEEADDEEDMEDDEEGCDIQEIEDMFLADLEDDDAEVAEVASGSPPALVGNTQADDAKSVSGVATSEVAPWLQPLPAEEAEAVSSDSEDDERELNLSEYEISDDDDEAMEVPVDVSDGEEELQDFDDIGDDDWEDDDDWKNCEEESEEDEEDLGPLKHGFTTWLACLAEDLPHQLAKPQAAKNLKKRLLMELRQDAAEDSDRRLSVQWEHSLVFDDCPPLLGFTSRQDAEHLLHCKGLEDLQLNLAWSEEVKVPEATDEATPPKPKWKTVPPRQGLPAPVPARERSRSRDRQSVAYSSRPPYRETNEDQRFKAEARRTHSDRWWTKEFLSIPQENPKVAFDREGVLVVYKPAFWTVTTCADRDRVSSRYEALQDWIRANMGHRYPWLYSNDRAGLIHRLDVQTSGPIVVAGSPRAFKLLKESLHHHSFYKEYIALMHGALPIQKCCGVMDYPLLTTQERGYAGWRTCVDPSGQQAMTRYEAVAAYKYSEGHGKTQRYTLLRLQLITGKTHQIRVHLMELARRLNLKTHGIVGDYKYLPPRNLKLDKRICRRVFLHCYRLHFPMPDVAKEAKCKIRCPLPPELQYALKQVDFDKHLTAAYRKQNQKGSIMEVDDLMDQRKSTNIPGITDYDAPWSTLSSKRY